MKFLLDMPLSPALAAWLREQGHDAVHAVDLGLAQASDGDILDRARREERVVMTADLDYPRLLAMARSDRPGLTLFRGGDYSEQEAKDRLKRCLEVIPIAEFASSIIVIERGRIRQRRLRI